MFAVHREPSWSCASLRGRRFVIWALVLIGLFFLLKEIISQSSTGVGGQGAANILVQCVFKSFWSQDDFVKSGAVFSKVTDVLRQKVDGQEVDHGYFAQHFPTDKEDLHNYTLYYDQLFAPYVASSQRAGMAPQAILEVGVKKGGSLKLWRELFGWDTMVYGLDIDPGAPTFIRDGHIKTLVFDSRKPELAEKSLRGLQFDIIIDDGDHSGSGQYWTKQSLWQFLKPDGVYIVEDVSAGFRITPNWNVPGGYWSRHVDKTVYEHVTFIYPPQSRAPRLKIGKIEDSDNPKPLHDE